MQQVLPLTFSHYQYFQIETKGNHDDTENRYKRHNHKVIRGEVIHYAAMFSIPIEIQSTGDPY